LPPAQVKLAPSHDELVCMATDGERLYATGSLDCVCILDPRAARAAGQLAKPVTSLAQQNVRPRFAELYCVESCRAQISEAT